MDCGLSELLKLVGILLVGGTFVCVIGYCYCVSEISSGHGIVNNFCGVLWYLFVCGILFALFVNDTKEEVEERCWRVIEPSNL